MRHRAWLLCAVAVMLLLLSGGTAFAQGGEGDKVVVGREYLLPAGQSLDGNLTVIGGNATLEEASIVHGDIAVLGGALGIAGTVRGDVTVFGGMVDLASTAEIQGDLADFGGEVRRAPGSIVGGETFGGPGIPLPPMPPNVPDIPIPGGDFTVEVHPRGPLSFIGRILLWQLKSIGWGLLLAILGVVAVVVSPKTVERVSRTAVSDPAVSFGVGLLTLAVAALAGGLLMIACGVGLLVWLATLLAVLLGWVAIGLWVGQQLLRAVKARSGSSLVEVAVGVFVITLLWRVPWCIGFLFGGIVGSIGLGAVVTTRFGTQDTGVSKKLAPSNGGLDPHPLTLASSGSGWEVEADDVASKVTDVPSGLEGVDLFVEPDVMPDEAASSSGQGDAIETGSPTDLAMIAGIGSRFATRLHQAGVQTLADLAATTPAELAALIDVSEERIVRDDWIGQARRLMH